MQHYQRNVKAIMMYCPTCGKMQSDLSKSNSAKDEYYARLCKIVDERDELKEKLASGNSNTESGK